MVIHKALIKRALEVAAELKLGRKLPLFKGFGAKFERKELIEETVSCRIT